MFEFERPNIEVEEISEDKKYGRFVVEPLERGYGITLGNSLRRIMLSSLPGAAVSQVKIEGVLHEFSSIPGVKEDVTEIILNLKELALKLYSDQGYLDLDYVLSKKCPFTLVIGGRGTGKTYGSICYSLDHEKQIAFIRRTQTQIDLLSKPDLNPFQAVAYDRSIDVYTTPASKQHSLIFVKRPEEEAHSIGFMAALSTFSNMRGFSSE